MTALDSAYTCSFAGPQRPLYLTLGRHGDTADQDGPYDILCWNDDSPTANGCGSAVIRLAGSSSPGAAATTGTATTPAKPFCVGGADLNGNRSAWSCTPLTIS